MRRRIAVPILLAAWLCVRPSGWAANLAPELVPQFVRSMPMHLGFLQQTLAWAGPARLAREMAVMVRATIGQPDLGAKFAAVTLIGAIRAPNPEAFYQQVAMLDKVYALAGTPVDSDSGRTEIAMEFERIAGAARQTFAAQDEGDLETALADLDKALIELWQDLSHSHGITLHSLALTQLQETPSQPVGDQAQMPSGVYLLFSDGGENSRALADEPQLLQDMARLTAERSATLEKQLPNALTQALMDVFNTMRWSRPGAYSVILDGMREGELPQGPLEGAAVESDPEKYLAASLRSAAMGLIAESIFLPDEQLLEVFLDSLREHGVNLGDINQLRKLTDELAQERNNPTLIKIGGLLWSRRDGRNLGMDPVEFHLHAIALNMILREMRQPDLIEPVRAALAPPEERVQTTLAAADAVAPASLAPLTISMIEEHLRRAPTGAASEPPAPGRAAVAVILRDRGGELEVLLTLRAESDEDPWSGHVAFPGGRVKPGDPSIDATAIREAREEVGLDLEAPGVRRIGRLPDLRPRLRASELAVTPVLFEVTGDPPLSLDPREVARTRWVPLAALQSGAHDGRTIFWWRPFRRVPISVPFVLRCWRYEGFTIWGLTRRILLGLLAQPDPGATPRS